MDISQAIEALLKKSKNDFISISKLRASLPIEYLKALGLRRSSSSIHQVINGIKPYTNDTYTFLKKGNSHFIAYNLPAKQLILNKIRNTPDISINKLKQCLPLNRVVLVEAINDLFAEAEIYAQISNKTYAISKIRICPITNKNKDLKEVKDDRDLFKQAFEIVAKGKTFVRIHAIREHLDWHQNQFDKILEDLNTSHVIQLHQGDPNDYSKAELERSYMDKKGKLRLTVSWVSNDY